MSDKLRLAEQRVCLNEKLFQEVKEKMRNRWDFENPLRVAVFGETSAGKSTLLTNMLLRIGDLQAYRLKIALQSSERSCTQRLHKICSEKVPMEFFDMPGINPSQKTSRQSVAARIIGGFQNPGTNVPMQTNFIERFGTGVQDLVSPSRHFFLGDPNNKPDCILLVLKHNDKDTKQNDFRVFLKELREMIGTVIVVVTHVDKIPEDLRKEKVKDFLDTIHAEATHHVVMTGEIDLINTNGFAVYDLEKISYLFHLIINNGNRRLPPR